MGNLFNFESPFWQGLGRCVDFVVLNLLTIMCSLPIVTFGAAITALYDSLERLETEEGNIVGGYFKSFISRFAKATIAWVILLAAMLIILAGVKVYWNAEMRILTVFSLAFVLLWLAVFVWFFPLLSRTQSTVYETLKKALLYGAGHLPVSLAMIAVQLIPFILLMYPELFVKLSFVLFLFWFSLVAEMSRRLVKRFAG